MIQVFSSADTGGTWNVLPKLSHGSSMVKPSLFAAQGGVVMAAV